MLRVTFSTLNIFIILSNVTSHPFLLFFSYFFSKIFILLFAHFCDLIFKFFKNLFIFIYLFLAVLGLCCCAWAFSSCSEQGLLFLGVCGPLLAVASLVAEHRLQAHGLQQLWCAGSVVVACGLQSSSSVVVHGLSCSAACGIFLDQGSNPRPLHWQADY